MLFNNNIILEILRSNFTLEIISYIENRVMELEDYELYFIFEPSVEYALLDSIAGMRVVDYSVKPVEEEQEKKYVEGVFEATVTLGGYEYIDGTGVFKENASEIWGVNFSFFAEEDKYFDFELMQAY